MKIAYLVWEYEDSKYPILVTEEDAKSVVWCYARERIVYAEIIEEE